MPPPNDPRTQQTFFVDEEGNVRRRLVSDREAEVLRDEGGDVYQLDEEGRRVYQEAAQREGVRERLQELPGGSAPLAGTMSALDHLLFGVPSLALRESDPNAALMAEVAQQDSPVTALATGAAAEVIPAILTGGGSALGRTVLLTPGGMAGALGNFAERELADALVSRGLSQGLARAVGVVAGSGVDGVASGILQTITDANITGQPIEAEQFAANGLFGLATGLVASVPGAALSGLSGARFRTFGQAAETMGEVGVDLDNAMPIDSRMGLPTEPARRASPNFVTRASSFVSNVPEDEIAIIAGNFRHAADEQGYMRANREAGASLGEAIDARNQAIGAVSDARERLTQLQRFLPEDQVDIVHPPDDPFGIASLDAPIPRSATRPNPLRPVFDSAIRNIEANLHPSVPTQGRLANRADRARATELQSAVRAALNGRRGWTNVDALAAVDQVLDHISANNVAGEMRTLQGRQLVETVQRQLESAASEHLGEAGQRLTQIHSDLSAWRVTERNLRNFIRSAGPDGRVRINESKLSESFRNGPHSARPRVDTYADLHNAFVYSHRLLDHAESLGADVTMARGQLDAAAGHLNRTRKWGEVMEARMHAIVKEAEGGGLQAAGGISGRTVAGAVAGTVLGGPVASVVGGALGLLGGSAWAFLSHPTTTLTRFGGFVQAVTDSRSAVSVGVGRLRTALEKGARAATVAGRQVPRLVGVLRGKEGEKEYRRAVDHIRSLASNPDALIDRVGRVSSAFEDFSPVYASTVASTMVNGVNYLMANLPVAEQPSPFSHLQQTRPSRIEMEMFIRRYHAIEDPISILDLAAANRLTVEHVDAVAAVYPQLLAAIQTEVAEMVGELTTLPSYSQRIQLGSLLRIPTDPTLEPGFIFALQQSYAQTTQQAQVQGPRRTSVHQSVATDTFSRSQSLELSL